MFRIERKAYYVGTWREDLVTDSTMRQIIARSHAEKGQKVKVKLSKEGLDISRTVLFQENFLSSFPLSDVYFITVNARHPTCLVCIVADPVKKYLILAIRTMTDVEAQEIIATFQRLKNNPTIHPGNVVLKRKDNGNWTLRERSQHNADRHMQEIFKEASSSNSSTTTTPIIYDPMPQPNGGVSVSVGGDSSGIPVTTRGERPRAHSASQTVVDGSEDEMALMRMEMETLSQELRDIKLVLEKAAPVTPRSATTATTSTATTFNNKHSHNHVETSHHVTTQVHRGGGRGGRGGSAVMSNGALVSARSEGGEVYLGNRPGEVRAFVEDHRDDEMRPHSSRSNRAPVIKPLFSNGKVQRQITVPEPAHTPNGNGAEPTAYTIQRRVTNDFVRVPAEPATSRKLSGSESFRTTSRVKFHPQASSRRSHDQQFRSMRVSRNSGVPSTIMRPIEEIYGHGNTLTKRQPPVVLVQHPVNAPHAHRHHHNGPGTVYVAQEPTYVSRPVTPPGTLRRADHAGSVYSIQNHEFHLVHKNGELDDVLL